MSRLGWAAAGPGRRRGVPHRPATRAARTATLVAAVGLVLSACAGGPASPAPGATAGPTSTGTAGAPLTGDLVVFAAASLQQTFTQLGDALMAQNPGLHVTFSFAGSSSLAAQLQQGAPADVFAAANTSTMKAASDVTDPPVVFAHNTLEIAVPKGNPGHVTGLADLARPELKIALCAPEVPCGSAAVAVFAAAGLTPAPDTYEQDVTATLTKVRLGEVDAALVYRTDVRSAGDSVQGIDFPQAAAARNDYPIATLARAPDRAAADAFVALVLSPQGQRVLADAGFDGA